MKAKLSEMFAALQGITRLGIPFVKPGADKGAVIPDIVALSYQSTSLHHENQVLVMESLDGRLDKQERAAQLSLKFLEEAYSVLLRYPDLPIESLDGRKGGVAADIAFHIQEMLTREQTQTPRVLEKVLNSKIKDAFAAEYLPKGEPVVKERPDYEEVEGADEMPPPKKAGRPRAKAPAPAAAL